MTLETGMTSIGLLFFGYLIGSIPFGVIFSKWMAGVDPRTCGSRNIGFTNVLRTAGRGPALLTLIGDMGKGYLVVGLSRQLLMGDSWAWMTGIAAILGHLYPVTLGFKGGKGVATGLGVLYGIHPLLGWFTVAVWGITVWFWRYSSLGAIVAFGLMPISFLWLQPAPKSIILSLVFTALILLKHRSNIQRLRSGTEPKLGRT